MTAEAAAVAERTRLGLADLPAAALPVIDEAGELARAVDREAADPWDTLRALGQHGLLSAPLPLQVELVHALARRCTATAFSLWGHRSGLEYHAVTGTPPPAGSETGTPALASGMAPAYKEEAGLGEIPLVATDQADGSLAVSGVLPWCSNLRPGSWIVLPVRWEDGRRAIVRVARDAAGVSVKPLVGLAALDGTSSGVLRLEQVAVAPHDVLTEDVPAFRDRARAAFLLIQSGMCPGLAGAALDAAEAAADPVARRVLGAEIEAGREDWETLREDLVRAVEEAADAADAAGPAVDAPGASRRQLVTVRLETALLAGRATRLEQKTVGGRGYALASDTSRRAREAAFLPVQSPTEIHLRHLLAPTGEAPRSPS
ncbi:acyl-CoA dehydrogenase family protein [Brachybacterium sacelli]|uniref:Alkylation response protein AidB-like acyl-CoA dehydrogenase n=1 Tax=Brachybacterium sacelli TaxID=173364 RepID=A0ABS4WWG8_9MICO|nr:acyl-CoA dehydrogenase family protein [Brachybacterium sacelli]MBP2380537.1 alkylation response protein AidB-like acyl-CoA dehydrogenase [Brachybacterium sacelli]